jgi:AcrR family transcriptional regulator
MTKARSGLELGSAGQETANRIVDAACKLILNNSYAKATIVEVCQAAGVSTGSSYYAFKRGKLEIGAAVYRLWANELRATVDSTDMGSTKSPVEFLNKRLLPVYGGWFVAKPRRAAFMFEFEVVAAGTEFRIEINNARNLLQETLCRVLTNAAGPWQFGKLSLPEVEAIVLGPIRLIIAAWALSDKGAAEPSRLMPVLAKAAAGALTAVYGGG